MENTTDCKSGDSYLLIQATFLRSYQDYIYRVMFSVSLQILSGLIRSGKYLNTAMYLEETIGFGEGENGYP